ncbi:Mg2+ transporter protein, CorA [Bacillus cereus AH676]|nr:Mg2+ transporter protein, CorA [Bacillus cereus AH676]
MKDSVTHMMSTITKPWASPSNGTFTFIPKKLETIVGKDKMIVIDVNSFITLFKLFDITELKVFIIPLKM